MTASSEGAPLAEPYECIFEFQPGWIDLTLQEGTKAEAMALATEVVSGLNPLGLAIETRAAFDDMVQRAVRLNDDVPVLAAAYYTETGEALANLMVDGYRDEGVPRPSAEEVTPLMLQWANAQVTGEPQITRLELPAGPAVRVQSMLKVKRRLGFGRKLTEYIRYAVFPPRLQTLVVVTITWEKIARSEEITALADEAVRSMQLNPVSREGVPIPADGETE
ncbi:hypothetical protein LXH13_12115 [Streptomyces spinosirectus]|uniref:hypothetical protein n=2 Tax=Streptomyces TaxID=1883 RepID=UPI000D473654|nr:MULTISPECIES: hypothetical protein [Streptomyces]PTM99576.1 hypothetical protein C7821_102525 [Streptomyces sp. VMFN-G11Ma]UIR17737.1 hypothetical protein LXH13_12115 [Streptomyces spinosirectus]